MTTPELYVVCGFPGVGKTSISKSLASMINAERESTDEVRKERFGPEPDYTWWESKRVYNILLDRARDHLMNGDSVVLDGTFMYGKSRKKAQRIASYHDTTAKIVKVEADEHVVRERIREREDSLSDADVGVYEHVKENWTKIGVPHETVDNSNGWDETASQLGDIIRKS